MRAEEQYEQREYWNEASDASMQRELLLLVQYDLSLPKSIPVTQFNHLSQLSSQKLLSKKEYGLSAKQGN